MRISTLLILAKHVWKNKLSNSSTRWVIGICNVLLLVALLSGYQNLTRQQETSSHFSHEVRERWEKRPDKHPHRMAHYGYVAFRLPYPLSFIDYGMDSYVGKAVFLEAHKQNTVNFSEASHSNGLLRFGEITAAMIWQLLLPLFIIFLGYDLIAQERESGTLRILLSQGVSWQELIFGKSLGLFVLVLSLILPSIFIGFLLLLMNDQAFAIPFIYVRFLILVSAYLLYLLVISIITILISANSPHIKSALIQLIGLWLLFTLIIPKVSQVISFNMYPTPSKIEFDTTIEKEIIKQGDSHNPNDPYFKKIKDSLLAAYKVDSTQKLPFNYSGYIMREGEKLSADTYKKHQESLTRSYIKQQNIIRLTAIINPYIAIKNISMALSGADYFAFADFQFQTESYRYSLAQRMNELQMKYISNKTKTSADKQSKISRKNWSEFPDFHHEFLSLSTVLYQELVSFTTLIFWLIGLCFGIKLFTKNLSAY